MALLADAVASDGLELRGIDDGARARIGEVLFSGAVATFAGDPFRIHGKNRRSVLIQCARYMQRRSGMAKNTFFRDGTCEIGIGQIFVPWGKIVGFAPGVVSDGRLEQVSAEIDQIAARVRAGADYKVDAVVASVARIFPMLPVTRRR